MMSGWARDLCTATKAGLEMMARHEVHTHRDRLRDLSGSHERISKKTSADGGGRGFGAMAALARREAFTIDRLDLRLAK
jgi:hypothetical protein